MKSISFDKNKIYCSVLVFLLVINPLFFIINHFSFTITFYKRPNSAQSEITLTFGVMGLPGDWDFAITDSQNVLYEYYRLNSIESLIWQKENSLEAVSHLAKSWEYELWPEEYNSQGFKNRGGVKAINITLRKGVKFHDGSDWNATVAKWNIDRLFIITGNLTGNGDRRNQYKYWKSVDNIEPYFTASWNLSHYNADGVNFSPINYSYYLIDDTTEIYNPNPYGGFDPVTNLYLHYAPYDMFPIIRLVEVIDDQQSGGKIRVEFNDWNSNGILSLQIPMISMHYYKDYSDRGIYGYENGILNPQNPTIIDHMIGTGPYLYIEHDEIGLPPRGYMLKNENYWNKTALEADGWYDIDRLEIINFHVGQFGGDAMNTALLTNALDYALENIYFPLEYDIIASNPNMALIEEGVSPYIKQVSLNCINETWWTGEPFAHFGGVNISKWYPAEQGYPSCGGVPRILRKAISYAFHYNLLIITVQDERVVRAGGMLGIDNIYYNSSIPLADYNLTKAREILLFSEDDPYTFTYDQDIYNFSKLCAERGLDIDSTDNEWRNIANTDPLFVLDFYWDYAYDDIKDVLLSSLSNIGCTLRDKTGAINKVPTQMWDYLSRYWTTTFDSTHSIWSSNAYPLDYPMSETIPEAQIEAYYGDPNYGMWRSPTYTITDNFPSWNLAFCYDSEVNDWLARISISNTTGKLELFNKIAKKVQTELYPMLYISQAKNYLALWKKWDLNFYRGPLFFANFRYLGPPFEPILSTDADIPDNDGSFNLSWTTSAKTDNYSLYSYNNLIWDINGSHNLLYYQNATSSTLISGLSNGDYYFVVVAHNQYGNTLSNNIHVVVNIYREPAEPVISGYNTLVIFCIAIYTAVILFKKKKIKLKWR